jgi:Ca2+-binding RTX toxin-like protein
MGHKATIVLKPPRIQIRGTSGPDVIVANDRPNFINGKGGNDIICARGRGDVVRGGAGNDILSTGPGNDEVWGDRGNDVVLGRHGSDEAVGDLGDDSIHLGRGVDTIDYETTGPLMINLTAGVATGALGNDKIHGAETIFADGKLTEIDGNEAANRLELFDQAPGLIVHGYGGNDTISCDSACPDSQLFGGAGADKFIGGLFSDTEHGGPGNDTLDGEAGDDTLIGDDGTDTAYGSSGIDTCIAEIRIDCED